MLELPSGGVSGNDRHRVAIVQVVLRELGFLTRRDFNYGEFNSIVDEAVGSFCVSEGLSQNNGMDRNFVESFNRVVLRSFGGNGGTTPKPDIDLGQLITQVGAVYSWLKEGAEDPEDQIDQYGDAIVEAAIEGFNRMKTDAIGEATIKVEKLRGE